MLARRTLLKSLSSFAAIVIMPAQARPVLPKGLDKDNDQTIDLDEAKAAASALFDKLDRDHEGTLDARELHVKLTKSELGDADPDKDATLTKDEFLALVDKRFKAADMDGDGTLDAKELHSKAGRDVLKLLK